MRVQLGFPGAGAGGPGGAGGYRFSEDQAQRIFEELFGGGLGGFGSSSGGAGGPRVRVFSGGPGGGGGGLGEEKKARASHVIQPTKADSRACFYPQHPPYCVQKI